jgi:hypothetical protein
VAGLSRDLSTIYVAFEHEVLPVDLPATLVVHRNKTWIDIADQLDRLTDIPSRAVDLRYSIPGSGIQGTSSWLLSKDLRDLATPWTRLLWGPPGAGKTYCLASLIGDLTRQPNERVLLLAPSNIAVDVATLQYLRIIEMTSAGANLVSGRRVLRYGYPRDERILKRPELLGPEDLEDLSRSIDAGFREIRLLSERQAPDAEIAVARARVKQLSEERKKRIAFHAAGAQVVATTLAALAAPTCPLLQAGPWQTVILDEASMVGGAAVMFLASLATQRFLVAGDPRQLGPVFEWQGEPPAATQTWLARDPYEVAGLSIGSGLNKAVNTHDARVARIMSQRRCHSDLWRLISWQYPDVSSETEKDRLQAIANLAPGAGQAFVVLDLSPARLPATVAAICEQSADDVGRDYESACRKIGRTWQNPPTANIAIDVAREVRAQEPMLVLLSLRRTEDKSD